MRDERARIAAERGTIDDVIMAHATRARIARALAMLRNKHVEMPGRKRENLRRVRGAIEPPTGSISVESS